METSMNVSKKVIAIGAALAMALFVMVGCYGGSASSSAASSTSSAASLASSSSAEPSSSSSASSSSQSQKSEEASASAASADDFAAAVQDAIAGDISTSKGEVITGVTFENGKLVVNVDMGSSYDSDPGVGNLTMAQTVALSRFSSITDTILEMGEYSDLWESVTVDFGENGSITKNQSEAVDSSYGRYFDVQDSDLA